MKISPLLTWGHVCTFLVCSSHIIIIIIRVSVASITSSERAAPLARPNLRLIPSDLLLPDLQQAARMPERITRAPGGGWVAGGGVQLSARRAHAFGLQPWLNCQCVASTVRTRQR